MSSTSAEADAADRVVSQHLSRVQEAPIAEFEEHRARDQDRVTRCREAGKVGRMRARNRELEGAAVTVDHHVLRRTPITIDSSDEELHHGEVAVDADDRS